jgi:hypothetical protein
MEREYRYNTAIDTVPDSAGQWIIDLGNNASV